MKKTLLFIGLLMSTMAFGQSGTQISNPANADQSALFVSIRPVDGRGAVFPTQAELDAKIDDKIDKIKQLILENKDKPSELEKLQTELWRFENAVVVSTNK